MYVYFMLFFRGSEEQMTKNKRKMDRLESEIEFMRVNFQKIIYFIISIMVVMWILIF